jgi:hypothetical protein
MEFLVFLVIVIFGAGLTQQSEKMNVVIYLKEENNQALLPINNIMYNRNAHLNFTIEIMGEDDSFKTSKICKYSFLLPLVK